MNLESGRIEEMKAPKLRLSVIDPKQSSKSVAVS
jgi:hypothetical protein